MESYSPEREYDPTTDGRHRYRATQRKFRRTSLPPGEGTCPHTGHSLPPGSVRWWWTEDLKEALEGTGDEIVAAFGTPTRVEYLLPRHNRTGYTLLVYENKQEGIIESVSFARM